MFNELKNHDGELQNDKGITIEPLHLPDSCSRKLPSASKTEQLVNLPDLAASAAHLVER
jgi:hypothetical protein